MVETNYISRCGFQGCEKGFESKGLTPKDKAKVESLAKACEAQGSIGPDMGLGFMLSIPTNSYLINMSTRINEGHERKYGFLFIHCGYGTFQDYEDLFNGNNPDKPSLSQDVDIYTIKELKRKILKYKEIELLTDEEFTSIDELIKEGNGFKGIRSFLGEAVDRLHNTNPYFESLIKKPNL